MHRATISKLSGNAAIAQSVERILGKDEVASSNLASSSMKKPRTPTGFGLSSFLCGMEALTETDTKTDTGHNAASKNTGNCAKDSSRCFIYG